MGLVYKLKSKVQKEDLNMKWLISGIAVVLLTMLLIFGCKSKAILKEPPESLTIIDGFESLEDSFIDYKFKIKEKASSFTIKGKYDINNDGKKDQISLVLQNDSNTRIITYIEVNGIRQETYMDFTYDGEVRLLDLDKNDDFIEIAFFDEGPSADPHYHIYRYDGEELYRIGHLDDKALVNGEGKIIPSGYISDFEPAFYSAWLEIENKEFINEKEIDKYLGKEYILHKRKNSIFFVPMKEMPEDFSPYWEETREFETTKLRLMNILYPYYDNNLLNFYFVELANGEKGLLYFWIGD